MFLIHYLQMPGRHRLVMWYRTHASESHVQCGSGLGIGMPKLSYLVRLYRLAFLKDLGTSQFLTSRHKLSCWGDKTEHRKIIYTWNENLWRFFRKQFGVNILNPTSSLPLLVDSVILSSLTQSSTMGKGRGWSSLWLHHRLGEDLSGNTFTKRDLPLTW